jgi:renalase
MKILIIGSGLSGCSSAYNINKIIKNNNIKASLKIFDKGQNLGGRITTTYGKCMNNYFDLGFKNINKGEGRGNHYSPSSKLSYRDMFQNNVLKFSEIDLSDKQKIYIPKGGTHLMNHLLQDTDVDIYSNTKIVSINQVKNCNIWEVITNKNKKYLFDIIISTIPVPQLLEMKGNFLKNVEKELLNKMKKVEYHNTFSLGSVYQFQILGNPEKMNFFENDTNDEIIQSISIKNISGIKHQFSINIQARNDWSFNNFNEDKNIVKKKIKDNVQNILPFLRGINPFYEKMMRWKYSFVKDGTNISKKMKDASIILKDNPHPLFILAGDSISGSNFESCIRSGLISSTIVENKIKNNF